MFEIPQKVAPVKADLFTCGSGTVVFCYSLLIKLSIGSENYALSLCLNVVGFHKSGHI